MLPSQNFCHKDYLKYESSNINSSENTPKAMVVSGQTDEDKCLPAFSKSAGKVKDLIKDASLHQGYEHNSFALFVVLSKTLKRICIFHILLQI